MRGEDGRPNLVYPNVCVIELRCVIEIRPVIYLQYIDNKILFYSAP